MTAPKAPASHQDLEATENDDDVVDVYQYKTPETALQV